MHFENVYWDAGWMKDDHRAASILAIGDSWFWYPFPGGSLLNQLGRVVAPMQHTCPMRRSDQRKPLISDDKRVK